MNFRTLVPAALVCLALLPSTARAAIVAAEYVPAGFNSGSSVAGFNSGAFRPGQTFTALVGGLVSEVSVGVWSSAANDVIVELRSTSGGLPTTTVLASATIATGSAFASGTLYTADFSASGASLDVGSVYAIVLRTANASPNVGWSGGFAVAPGPYAGGQFVASSNSGSTFSASATSDAVFRVTVADTPEPSTLGMLGAAGLAGLLARRRR